VSEGLRTAYINARLLDPASGLDSPGALLTEGAEIADLGPDLFADGVPEGVAVIDCGGHGLAPGLIDMHVYLREPGAEHKETLASGSHAAAAGGVTTMICMPNTQPAIDDIALVVFIARRARDTAIVNVHPMAAVTKGLAGREMTEMGMLAEVGAVAFTDGHLPITDAQVMRRVLSYASTFDLLIVHHVEDPSLVGEGCVTEGEIATRLGLPGIPVAAEVIMIERDMRLVELTGGRYHAAHVSTAEGLAVARAAKARGLRFTCGAAVHNFALNESAIGEYRTFAKTAPPLRAESDRQALVEGLRDGTIDVISTGHSPQDQEGKRLPFAQAAYGIVGLETLLPLALELFHKGELGLLEVLAMMTARPAELLRLPCGVLRRGAPSDLVLIDLDVPWRIDADRFRSKSKNSPFDERPVQGRAIRTIVGGETVFELATDA
jgi:dihydroorotase